MNAPVAQPDWIAVDWGTTSLRVWAVGRDGAVIGRASSQDGMGRLERENYEPVLLRLIGGFLASATAPVPVIVCGMAGARLGWREAAYRQVPCPPVDAGGMTSVETADPRISVSIVPGLSQAEPADVMRGEETQLAGIARLRGVSDAIVCMPGTHSKWVRLEGGIVASFRTYMTGELFAMASRETILRLSIAGEGTDGDDQDAFLAAVSEMLQRPEQLTGALFSVRAGTLLGGLTPAQARSRLSGLMIGAELAATRPLWERRSVHLVAAASLAETYRSAIETAGGTVTVEDAEALTLSGLAEARNRMKAAAS